MGDRANIYVVDQGDPEKGVYLYTHWGGTRLPETLRRGLSRHLRWNDGAYLTRILFDAMTEGEHGRETGFGISATCGDGAERIFVVDPEKGEVRIEGRPEVWGFQEYIDSGPKEWQEFEDKPC